MVGHAHCPAEMLSAGSARARWWEVSRPYRHIVASDVLNEADYGRVSSAFNELLIEDPTRSRRPFQQTTPNYDAHILGIDAEIAEVFRPFFSVNWLSNMAALLDLPFLPRVDGALHSSPPGSRTGWIHSDYCSGWFPDPGEAEGLAFPDRLKCEYFTGTARSADASPVRFVRAATLIYYLNNDDWQPGDGGETELLAASQWTPRTPVTLIKPLNNSLVIFECRPHSYHRFLTNTRQKRNSIILWLHTTMSYASNRWGPPPR